METLGYIFRYVALPELPQLSGRVAEFLFLFFRIVAIKKTDVLWPLIISETLIIVAPAFLAANGLHFSDTRGLS
jgi:hypothetical protein